MKIYSSESSEIEYEGNKSLLQQSWLKESIQLNEEEVKSEIGKVLLFAQEFKIKRVIIDARNYPFRENQSIQNWINFTYMPQIMDVGVEKYAFVVSENLEDLFKTFGEQDSESMQVEYFAEEDKARAWVEA